MEMRMLIHLFALHRMRLTQGIKDDAVVTRVGPPFVLRLVPATDKASLTSLSCPLQYPSRSSEENTKEALSTCSRRLTGWRRAGGTWCGERGVTGGYSEAA
jgi:hypothetical protein